MLKAILFDLDGVLVDACDWHYHALNMSLKENCGYEIDRKDHIRNFNGIPTSKKLEILHKRGIIQKEQFKKIWEDKQKYTINAINNHSKIDVEKINIHHYLSQKGYKLCCVTNSIKKTAELMLKKTDQFKYMNFIITNEDVKNPKPSPECYNKAVHLLNLKPENCLIVEDSEKGLAAAIGSKCHYLKVNSYKEVNIENILNKIRLIEETKNENFNPNGRRRK